MPKFLTKKDIYKIIQRELPDKAYAYSTRPKDFYTTSDDDSAAFALSKVYENLEVIYDNYFPQTSTEKLEDWETTVFGAVDETNATIAQRRDRLLSKIRSRKGITVQDIRDIVFSIIGSDKDVEIIEKGCESGAWILGKSKLSRNTFLGISSVGGGVTIPPDFSACQSEAWLQLGITEQQFVELQTQAYSYEIRIRGYDATQLERDRLTLELNKFEPARSKHSIVSPFSPIVIQESWKLSRSKLGSRTFLS